MTSIHSQLLPWLGVIKSNLAGPLIGMGKDGNNRDIATNIRLWAVTCCLFPLLLQQLFLIFIDWHCHLWQAHSTAIGHLLPTLGSDQERGWCSDALLFLANAAGSISETVCSLDIKSFDSNGNEIAH